MAPFNINAGDTSWDEKVATKSSLFPDGDYVVFISEAEYGLTANTKTPCVDIVFTCHDPANKYRNSSLRYQTFYLTDKAMPRFIRMLRACGATKPFDVSDSRALSEHLIDRMLKITVKSRTEEYKGEMKKKVEASYFAPLTHQEKARLVEEYGDTMLPPLSDDEHVASPTPGFDSSDEDVPF